jgi:hypothetical protein
MTKVKTSLTVGKYKGKGAFGDWLRDYHKEVRREARYRLRGSAFYCRKIARNSMRPAGKPKKVVGLPWPITKPSEPGKAPRYRKGKQLKTMIVEKINIDTYRVIPKQFTNVGHSVRFNVPEMMEFGGTGQVRLPLTLGEMSPKQRAGVLSKAQTWPMAWKNAHYKPRPFIAPAWDKTYDRFPEMFSNLNKRKRY